MAPIVTRLGSTDGFMTKREKNYFIRRAEGGRALITVENATILPHEEPEPRYDGIWDDKFLPTWIEFANVIHDAGSKVSLQLCHVGSQGKPRSYLRDCPDEDKRSTEDGGRYCCNPMSTVYQDYQHQGTKAGNKAQGYGPYRDPCDGYEIALWKGITSSITRET